MKRLLSMLAVALIVMCASAAEKTQAVFNVNPPMSCQNCENKIKSNLRFEKGVKQIETSLQNQTVTVTYDPAKTTVENLEEAFRKIGYEACVAPAESSAAKTQHCTKPDKGCCKKAAGCTGKKADKKDCCKKDCKKADKK